MFIRITILISVTALTGCGKTPPQSVPVEKAAIALPPEVEYDPATATEKHRAAQKAPRR